MTRSLSFAALTLLAALLPGGLLAAEVPPPPDDPPEPPYVPTETIELVPVVSANGCSHGKGGHPEWSVTPLAKGKWRIEFSDYHNGTERIPVDEVRAWMQGDELRIRYEVEGNPDPMAPVLACGGTTDVTLEAALPRPPKDITIYRSRREERPRWQVRRAGDAWRRINDQHPWYVEAEQVHDGVDCRFLRQDAIGTDTVQVAIEGTSCVDAQYVLTVASADGRTLHRAVAWLSDLYVPTVTQPGADESDYRFEFRRDEEARAAAKALIARPTVQAVGGPGYFSDAAGATCRHEVDEGWGKREAYAAATQWVALPTGVGTTAYLVPNPKHRNRYDIVGRCASR